MSTTHIKHTHFPIATELRCLGIPTTWSPRVDKLSGERALVPMVSQNVERRPARITDPYEIRKRFFQMKHNEDAALDFLTDVGVWSAVEDRQLSTWSDGSLRSGNASVGIKEMLLMGAFGHRFFIGRALPVTLDYLWKQQGHWRGLLRNPCRLRKDFGPPPCADSRPADKDAFALESRFGNTLPVHLEWKGKHPRAVIQPITGEELLIALAWIDVVTEEKFKVCQNPKCGIEYTRGGRKFCTWQCEHANTVRTWRNKPS